MLICILNIYIYTQKYGFHQTSRKTFAGWKQVGTFPAPPGKSQCTDCRAGYYQPAVASTSCLQCESGLVAGVVLCPNFHPRAPMLASFGAPWGSRSDSSYASTSCIDAWKNGQQMATAIVQVTSYGKGGRPCSQSVSIGQSSANRANGGDCQRLGAFCSKLACCTLLGSGMRCWKLCSVANRHVHLLSPRQLWWVTGHKLDKLYWYSTDVKRFWFYFDLYILWFDPFSAPIFFFKSPISMFDVQILRHICHLYPRYISYPLGFSASLFSFEGKVRLREARQSECSLCPAGWYGNARRFVIDVAAQIDDPPVNSHINYWTSPFFLGKSTIKLAIFNSKLLVYQRVTSIVGMTVASQHPSSVTFGYLREGSSNPP